MPSVNNDDNNDLAQTYFHDEKIIVAIVICSFLQLLATFKNLVEFRLMHETKFSIHFFRCLIELTIEVANRLNVPNTGNSKKLRNKPETWKQNVAERGAIAVFEAMSKSTPLR